MVQPASGEATGPGPAAPRRRSGNPLEESVTRVVEPVVGDAGLYLEEVRVTRAGKRSVVRITLDLPEDSVGSLDSDTLGEASRAISGALDADDVVSGAYTLEISTPGVSRPLTEARHFRRARTRLVTLTLADGGADAGRLTDVTGSGDAVVLVLDGSREVPLGRVRKGAVEVELKRAEDAEDAGWTEPGESSGADDDAVNRLPRHGAAGRDEEG